MDEESTFRLYTKEEADARGIGFITFLKEGQQNETNH